MVGPPWTTKLAPVEGVELWTALVEQPPEVFRECRQTLSLSELDRFSAFGNRNQADAFLIRRGTIRHLLAKALGAVPSKIDLSTPPLQKPHLAGGEFEFSISSSKGLALFGISQDKPVGVDIEWMDPQFEFDSMLHDYFSLREQSALAGEGQSGFFKAWTRKEACAKAFGLGLSISLRELEATIENKIIYCEHSLNIRSLYDLPSGYAAAVAMQPRRVALPADFGWEELGDKGFIVGP